jgi:hypothetical protein
MTGWNGRRVRRLIDLVLQLKGTRCHLCLDPGADSVDHDPPRSVLIAQRVPDPDALCYLHPSHLSCNRRRKARPITAALRAELQLRRLDPGAAAARAASTADASPRFDSLRADERSRRITCPPSPRWAEKSAGTEAK